VTGGDETFEPLYKRHYRQVVAFFSRRGFSPQDSHDLTQDTFFRVFKGIGEFRRDSRFERWLFEIAANVYRNELRRKAAGKREGRTESLDDVMERDPSIVSDGPGAGASDSPSPLDEVIAGERVEAMRRVVAGMPTKMRRCVFLRFEQGLKYREIAVVLKISVDTVKAHLHQARQRLKQELAEDLTDDREE
jgi:RNA polymerase sigma-70 factor (ECF subfamily)